MSSHRILHDAFRAPFRMTDPGASGTITVDRDRAVVPVVTATAESRTLAQPTKAGLICTVELDTDGGDLTLTVTGGYNQAAATSLTLGDAGDFVTFISIKVGASYYWRVLQGSEGVSVRSVQYVVNTGAKIGGTAGWTLGGGTVNTGLCATMAASQTAGKLVIPITGLKVGDIITAFSVVGQIESAGGTVTLDADLRKHTAAAADVADASVGSITQISKTADYAISDAKTGLTEVVAADETFYVLLTGTTAASTDIALQGITLTVTEV